MAHYQDTAFPTHLKPIGLGKGKKFPFSIKMSFVLEHSGLFLRVENSEADRIL